MERLKLPDNIKIHFASLEAAKKITALKEMGVNYGLFSAYSYVLKRIFGGKNSLTENDKILIDSLCGFNHIIQDSGLFSLLYGAKKHLASKEVIFKWYDSLIDFTLEHGHDFTVVEIDCQDILGTNVAWEFRERMRSDLPNHRIMNVFHLSDEIKGLDRLIEFSDYIGIGSGSPNDSGATMYEVSSYIKKKNPNIDIHLLGCTQLKILKKCNYCTSADSITWLSPQRFGRIGNYHISDLDKQKIINMVGEEIYMNIKGNSSDISANSFIASIEQHKRWYQINAGNQDYTKNFK